MIKKILIAVAMTTMTIGTVTAAGVVSSGVAGAATPTSISCTLSGGGSFVAPGISAGGALTNKSSLKATDTISTFTGAGCPTAAQSVSVVSATTPCPQTAGVPNSGDPSACLASSVVKGNTVYAIAKDPDYYDTSGGYVISGLNDLQTGLQAKPIKSTIDGIAVVETVNSVSAVEPASGGLCGSTYAGFDIAGDVQVKALNIGTYTQVECLTSDTGTNVTGNLATDILSPTALITGITIGGPDSLLTVTIPTPSCSVAGTVTFASPGLSAGGTLTNKSSEKTASSTTASGTGCPGVASALSIVSTTTPCPQTAGVPNSGDPSACLASSVVKGNTVYAIAKDPNYYDTTGSYAGTGLTDLEAALSAKPIKATVNNLAVELVFTSAAEVYPTSVPGGSGLCGATDVGFNVQGNVQVKSATVGTYDELVCLSNDTGPNTTGNFLNDLLITPGAVIQSATVGGDSSLTVTF
jgi:hypothetical protein